jgi:PAS domain S-box-containing protein
MVENKESILVLEIDIDLQFMAGILENESYIVEFETIPESFIAKVKKSRYSAFIISLNQKEVSENIINAITWSVNIFTPVLVVCPEIDSKLVSDLTRYKFEMISFPFTSDEFLFRIGKMIRQNQNEESVHNNLVKYRSLFDNFPLGIVQTDQHGAFIAINKSFIQFTNMTEKEMYGENFFQLCHPDDYFIERKQLDRLLRKVTEKVDYEIRLINNDGVTCVCKVIANSQWENNGSFSHFTFILEKII